MKFNKGDKVTVLDDDFEGVVSSVQGEQVTIETKDGFELTYHERELILMPGRLNINSSVPEMKQVLKEKEIPKPRSFVKEKKTREIPPPEFDLHIEKLAKNYKSMSNYDILTLQMDTAKYHIEFAIRNRIPKIVFIHGVGEGVLKAELDFMLGRYDNIDFRDANYQKYGLGATEVFIRQRQV
jgi:dsDNA-specific endonuclease/ATPase MutS2